jgi:hypothetical protein
VSEASHGSRVGKAKTDPRRRALPREEAQRRAGIGKRVLSYVTVAAFLAFGWLVAHHPVGRASGAAAGTAATAPNPAPPTPSAGAPPAGASSAPAGAPSFFPQGPTGAGGGSGYGFGSAPAGPTFSSGAS